MLCASSYRLVGLLDVGLDQGELVAAQARQRTEPRAVPAQAVGEGDQQLVAELVGVLLVDPLEIVEAQAQHCHPALPYRRRRGSGRVAAAATGGSAGR